MTAPIASAMGDNGVNMCGMGHGKTAITFFVNDKDAKKAFELIHPIVDELKLESVSMRKNVGLIVLNLSDQRWDTPGILAQATNALGEVGVNIIDVTTSDPHIMIYVDYEDLEKAEK